MNPLSRNEGVLPRLWSNWIETFSPDPCSFSPFQPFTQNPRKQPPHTPWSVTPPYQWSNTCSLFFIKASQNQRLHPLTSLSYLPFIPQLFGIWLLPPSLYWNRRPPRLTHCHTQWIIFSVLTSLNPLTPLTSLIISIFIKLHGHWELTVLYVLPHLFGPCSSHSAHFLCVPLSPLMLKSTTFNLKDPKSSGQNCLSLRL